MDIIFNLFKIKFKMLEELITAQCSDLAPNSKVNIFINLDCVFSKIANSKNEAELQLMNDKKKSYLLISNMINLAAHYRLFFSKNNIYSKVFMYTTYPFNSHFKNDSFVDGYRHYYISKFVSNPSNYLLNRVISENFETAKIIFEYINGVYLIESRSVENSIVPSTILEDVDNGCINFMVSTDPYDYQYVNKGFYILRPKKDESFIVTKKNLWSTLDIDTNIKPEFYSFVLSTTGDKMRSIPKVKGFGAKTTVKAIQQAIDKNLIGDTTTNISMLIRLIRDEFSETVLKNYQCIDLDAQLGYVHLSSKMAISKQLVDRFDNLGLKEITHQYFQDYPINIHEITDANRLLVAKRLV